MISYLSLLISIVVVGRDIVQINLIFIVGLT